MIELIVAIFAAIGSLLVASVQRRLRFVAFVIWLCTNLYLSFHFLFAGDMPMVYLYTFYTGTAIYGIYSNRRKE